MSSGSDNAAAAAAEVSHAVKRSTSDLRKMHPGDYLNDPHSDDMIDRHLVASTLEYMNMVNNMANVDEIDENDPVVVLDESPIVSETDSQEAEEATENEPLNSSLTIEEIIDQTVSQAVSEDDEDEAAEHEITVISKDETGDGEMGETSKVEPVSSYSRAKADLLKTLEDAIAKSMTTLKIDESTDAESAEVAPTEAEIAEIAEFAEQTKEMNKQFENIILAATRAAESVSPGSGSAEEKETTDTNNNLLINALQKMMGPEDNSGPGECIPLTRASSWLSEVLPTEEELIEMEAHFEELKLKEGEMSPNVEFSSSPCDHGDLTRKSSNSSSNTVISLSSIIEEDEEQEAENSIIYDEHDMSDVSSSNDEIDSEISDSKVAFDSKVEKDGLVTLLVEAADEADFKETKADVEAKVVEFEPKEEELQLKEAKAAESDAVEPKVEMSQSAAKKPEPKADDEAAKIAESGSKEGQLDETAAMSAQEETIMVEIKSEELKVESPEPEKSKVEDPATVEELKPSKEAPGASKAIETPSIVASGSGVKSRTSLSRGRGGGPLRIVRQFLKGNRSNPPPSPAPALTPILPPLPPASVSSDSSESMISAYAEGAKRFQNLMRKDHQAYHQRQGQSWSGAYFGPSSRGTPFRGGENRDARTRPYNMEHRIRTSQYYPSSQTTANPGTPRPDARLSGPSTASTRGLLNLRPMDPPQGTPRSLGLRPMPRPAFNFSGPTGPSARYPPPPPNVDFTENRGDFYGSRGGGRGQGRGRGGPFAPFESRPNRYRFPNSFSHQNQTQNQQPQHQLQQVNRRGDGSNLWFEPQTPPNLGRPRSHPIVGPSATFAPRDDQEQEGGPRADGAGGSLEGGYRRRYSDGRRRRIIDMNN